MSLTVTIWKKFKKIKYYKLSDVNIVVLLLVVVTGKRIHEVVYKLNILSQNLVKWVNSKGLALNLKNT